MDAIDKEGWKNIPPAIGAGFAEFSKALKDLRNYGYSN
jgi:hypothetical protein